LSGFFEADSHFAGYFRKALRNLLPKDVADARQFLAKATDEAAHVAFLTIRFLRHLEKVPHPRERRPISMPEAGIHTSVNLRHVGVENLKRKIFLVFKVMVE
jgi:hypothetical protein